MSGKYEPSVISSYILQSAFLAEEREHQQEEDWQTQVLATRAKNVLQRLQDQTVPHAILSDYKAYSSPPQHAASLEARRLVKNARSKETQGVDCHDPFAKMCRVMFIFLGMVGGCLFLLIYSPYLNVEHIAGWICVAGRIFFPLSAAAAIILCGMGLVYFRRKWVKISDYLHHTHDVNTFVCVVLCVWVGFSALLAVMYTHSGLCSLAVDNSTSTVDYSTIEMTTNYSHGPA